MADQPVPKRVEEALFFRLKRRAFEACSSTAAAYAECCRGRAVSMAWACRGEARELSACLSRYTSQLERVKQRWARQGRRQTLSEADWDALLRGLDAPGPD